MPTRGHLVLLGLLTIQDILCSNLCPGPSWIQNNGSCLLFSTQKLKWSEAVTECQNLNSDLLYFYSEQSRLNFANLIKSRGDITERWWTSLTDKGHPGAWTWGNSAASTLAKGNAVVWNIEPDDTHHTQNCGAYNIQGTVTDEACSEQHSYICEYHSSTKCLTDWYSSGSSCYYFGDQYTLTTWSDAEQQCQQMQISTNVPTHLMQLETKQEQQFVRSVLSEIKESSELWWIGMSDQTTEGAWKWRDGTVVNQASLVWAVEPDDLAGSELCGMIYNNGRFEDKSCDTLARYVCKTPQSDTVITKTLNQLGCPKNWLRAGIKCYQFNSATSNTWKDANTACQKQKARLLQITSTDEKSWIEYITLQYRAFAFWTGLNLHIETKVWYWSTGNAANMNLIRWNSEPNDFEGYEDCALILQDNTFNDFSCYQPNGYICELQSEDMPCPKQWTPSPDEGDFSCYFVSDISQNTTATWFEARDLCQRLANPMDGYLLAINTQAEETFISRLLKDKQPTAYGWWTGLNDIKEEGSWIYDTSFNNPVTSGIIPWNSEPNNSGGKDYCAVIYYGGRYNDVSCDEKVPFICEVNAHFNKISAQNKGTRLHSTTKIQGLLMLFVLNHVIHS